jgi:predicted nucleotidyltransferase
MQVFLNDVREWGESDARINGILLVGSYAKGTQREDSDIDLVIISSQKERLIHNPDFMNRFGHVKNFSVEFWGACTSFRIYYDDMEVEFGIVEPSWLHQPLDAGTRRVLADGYKVILDKSPALLSKPALDKIPGL